MEINGHVIKLEPHRYVPLINVDRISIDFFCYVYKYNINLILIVETPDSRQVHLEDQPKNLEPQLR